MYICLNIRDVDDSINKLLFNLIDPVVLEF